MLSKLIKWWSNYKRICSVKTTINHLVNDTKLSKQDVININRVADKVLNSFGSIVEPFDLSNPEFVELVVKELEEEIELSGI